MINLNIIKRFENKEETGHVSIDEKDSRIAALYAVNIIDSLIEASYDDNYTFKVMIEHNKDAMFVSLNRDPGVSGDEANETNERIYITTLVDPRQEVDYWHYSDHVANWITA